MQEVLISFGWFLYDHSKCGSCGTGPKERWKNSDFQGITITLLVQVKMFIVRRENRIIHQDYANNLFEYLTKII